MNSRLAFLVVLALALCALASSIPAMAQATGTLRGQVTDPSGAVVVSATVTVTSASGQAISTTSNKSGTYEIKNLPPGKYKLTAVAQGFSAYELTDVNVPAAVQQLDIALDIAVQKEQVVVQSENSTVDVSPTDNANATVLKDKDLDALSDDPDELASDLQALAGPSAGPNGGQIYIDGFTDGTLPPKASIREIRINQNPFSAQYDKLGYGRIEVFTKPGSDKWHGQVMMEANPKALNATNPYAEDPSAIPDYLTTQYAANISGALSKKASLFFNIERRNIEDNALINATVPPDSGLVGNQVVPTPRTRTNLSPRFDYQLTPNNTLTVRYQYLQNNEENGGIGQFTLPTQAYDVNTHEHTFQISDTQVLSPTVINETRFQYIRSHTEQTAISTDPTIAVPGNFNWGGNSQQQLADLADRFEFQNYTSMQRGKHFIKFGGRVRSSRQSDIAEQYTNGGFVFDGSFSRAADSSLPYSDAALADYANGKPGLAAPSRYIVTLSTAGTPIAHLSYVDAGLYAEDDWRVRPNLTLSYGLRYETQNDIGDHADFAPRVGLSWGLGSSKSTPKTVLRLGWGMFYDRFGQSNLLAIEHSQLQQQYTLQFTDAETAAQTCYSNYHAALPANVSELAAACTTTSPLTVNRTQLASNFQAPYTMQTAATLERQLGKVGTVSATYLNSRGVHQLLTINANAPYLTGYDPNVGTLTTYESAGIFKQNQLIVNTNLRVNTRVSLNSFYALGYANATASTPMNSADPLADYGRAPFDVRQRFFFGGSISLPWLIRFSPFMIVNSGSPYNITAGQDYNGDNVLNDRPVYANAATAAADLIQTPCGAVDVNPTNQALPGTKVIPVNCATGPANFTFNMRFSKTFGIGHKISRESNRSADANSQGGQGGPPPGRGPGGGMGGPRGMGSLFGSSTSDRRYNLTLSANIRNLFNTVNPAAPIGVLTSQDFGRSIALAGGPFSSGSAYNRRIELQLTFAF